MTWRIIKARRALYVDYGINVVVCDRLPRGQVTLLVDVEETTQMTDARGIIIESLSNEMCGACRAYSEHEGYTDRILEALAAAGFSIIQVPPGKAIMWADLDVGGVSTRTPEAPGSD